MNYDIKVIDTMSETTSSQRAANLRWLALQGEQTVIEAIKMQTDLIRQYRIEHRGQAMSPEFAYAMLSRALLKMTWLETAQTRKGDELSDAEFAQVQRVRIERIRGKKRAKASPKKELIRIRFFPLIETLRKEGLSWRGISDYLHTHHKTRLAYNYIRESFKEIQAENEKLADS